MANSPTSAPETQLNAAYATCRAIARSAAKNFYYSFLALPKHKRNALCAVYAFMRHADDISDDESLHPEERYHKLDEWLQNARRAFGGETTDDRPGRKHHHASTQDQHHQVGRRCAQRKPDAEFTPLLAHDV